MFPLLLITLLVLHEALLLTAKPKNVTIDDQNGDSVTKALPLYTGTGSAGWSLGSTCTGCAASRVVNASKTFDGTWHDGTGSSQNPVSIQMSFTGSAVYAYFILANDNLGDGITAQSSMTFAIDGQVVQNFTHKPTTAKDFTYNSSVFTNTTLVNMNHTVMIQTTGSSDSLILFDYLVYTSDPDTVVTTMSSTSTTSSSPGTATSGSSSSSSGSHKIGAVVGGVIGALAALFIVLGGLLIARRFRRQKRERMHIDIIDDADKEVAHPAGLNEQATIEPFVYSAVPNAFPNPYSDAPSRSTASASQEPHSTAPAPSASASSSSGNNTRSEGGDSSLRSQVHILMTELANMRAQQTLQGGSGMYERIEDEAPPPDYMPEGGVVGDEQRTERLQSDPSRRIGDSKASVMNP